MQQSGNPDVDSSQSISEQVSQVCTKYNIHNLIAVPTQVPSWLRYKDTNSKHVLVLNIGGTIACHETNEGNYTTYNERVYSYY